MDGSFWNFKGMSSTA